MSATRFGIPMILIILLAFAPVLSTAATPDYIKNPRILAQKKNFAEPRLLSKSQAAALATSRHGGKVLKVEPTETKGNYRVRLLLESGRIKTVAINSPRKSKKS